MAILSPTNLETISYRQQGWNAILSANMQILNNLLTPLFPAIESSTGLGSTSIANNTTTVDDLTTTVDDMNESVTDPAAQTQTEKTMAAVSGTGDDSNINSNFTDVNTALEEIRADVSAVLSKMSEIIDYVDTAKDKINEAISYCEEIDTHGNSNVDYCDSIKTTLNSALAALRRTGGAGVLDD